MTDRKKPGVAFWATVAMVVALLYVAGVGPANWVVAHDWVSPRVMLALVWFYEPLSWVHQRSPAPIRDALDWYYRLWI